MLSYLLYNVHACEYVSVWCELSQRNDDTNGLWWARSRPAHRQIITVGRIGEIPEGETIMANSTHKASILLNLSPKMLFQRSFFVVSASSWLQFTTSFQFAARLITNLLSGKEF